MANKVIFIRKTTIFDVRFVPRIHAGFLAVSVCSEMMWPIDAYERTAAQRLLYYLRVTDDPHFLSTDSLALTSPSKASAVPI